MQANNEVMPIVICSWCDYVGQGKTLEDQYNDAKEHERSCDYNEERPPFTEEEVEKVLAETKKLEKQNK